MIYPAAGSMLYMLLELITAFLFGGLLLGLHRKIIARIQGRPGPPIVQHLIHTFKFYIKELTIPETSSMPLYVAIVLVLSAVVGAGIFGRACITGAFQYHNNVLCCT